MANHQEILISFAFESETGDVTGVMVSLERRTLLLLAALLGPRECSAAWMGHLRGPGRHAEPAAPSAAPAVAPSVMQAALCCCSPGLAAGDGLESARSAAGTESAEGWARMAGLPHGELPSLAPIAEHVTDLHHATWYLEQNSLVVQRAVQLAASAHEGQLRKNGDPFITHPIETARILADLRMDLDTIVAGLLHDVVEDTDVSLETIESLFGSSVAAIVRGDTKASKMTDYAAALEHPDERREFNQRSMLLAMSDDWRIAVVKLADRLHNMRTLEHMPRHKQVRIARETIQIFVPLANRIGIDKLEYELLLLAVDYLFPQELKGLFGLELLGHWARVQFWGVLDDFLLKDQVLSELDVYTKLKGHRQRWKSHVDYWAVAFAE